MIHFRMNSCSWLALLILGMDICWFISRCSIFSCIYLAMITAVSVTTRNTILSWMIPCIDVGLTPFFDTASPMRRLNMFWMIATLDNVAVIYLGWLHPKKSFMLSISSLQYLNIVTRLLRNAHPVNIFIWKSALILLHCTLSLLLALLPNRGSIVCIVSLPQLGGMVTSS